MVAFQTIQSSWKKKKIYVVIDSSNGFVSGKIFIIHSYHQLAKRSLNLDLMSSSWLDNLPFNFLIKKKNGKKKDRLVMIVFRHDWKTAQGRWWIEIDYLKSVGHYCRSAKPFKCSRQPRFKPLNWFFLSFFLFLSFSTFWATLGTFFSRVCNKKLSVCLFWNCGCGKCSEYERPYSNSFFVVVVTLIPQFFKI